MEKITKKRKKSKKLRKKIAFIAVGALSLILTISLSVGATLAWFAGSTWASGTMYMGGPVYVEMAGRGAANGTTGDGESTASWKGGSGRLDITAAERTTGTPSTTYADDQLGVPQILLPGQKMLIFSQARVYSTANRSNRKDGSQQSTNSGADTTNTTGGEWKYQDNTGRVITTTSSVLRAKFSIDIELDPTVGFNNFTQASYADNYPTQSGAYKGDGVGAEQLEAGLAWDDALDGTGEGLKNAFGVASNDPASGEPTYKGRRDDVNENTSDNYSKFYKFPGTADEENLWKVKSGESISIYKWKYVSAREYEAAAEETAEGAEGIQMPAPFDGTKNSNKDASAVAGGTGNGFYGVWVTDESGNKVESDAFYKARTYAYIKSYEEQYVSEYGVPLDLKITDQLESLEKAMNDAFKLLVYKSSNDIIDSHVYGFTVDKTSGVMTPAKGTNGTSTSASFTSDISTKAPTWLYVDPSIGNDTNNGDSATSVGGWWYLVESSTDKVIEIDETSGEAKLPSAVNKVTTVVDNVTGAEGVTTTGADGLVDFDFSKQFSGGQALSVKNEPQETASAIQRVTGYGTETDPTCVADTDVKILNAKLYEIKPDIKLDESVGTRTPNTIKTVSVSFPFVNGNFELPGDSLTNVFANAKITFQITFQALQAFFPFTPSIDGLASGSPLAGTGKALNIANSIPIFNEAFNYLTQISN